MKLKGQRITPPEPKVIPIPRPPKEAEGDSDIIFLAQIVTDFSEFNILCPEPKPPMSVKPGDKSQYAEVDHPAYKKAMLEYENRRIDWMVLKALEATPELEWETVDMGKPETWHLYRQELRDAGFSTQEIIYITNEALSVNFIDEKAVDAARKRFLAGRQPPKGE